MEGDSFSDPRRRAARRPRGGGRGKPRGNDQHRPRVAHKVSQSSGRRSKPELGSNAYRFNQVDSDEEEHAYDAGVDFEQAASGSMYDPNENAMPNDSANLAEELSADYSQLDSVLKTVPLWILLGEHTRFALGVADDDVSENYVDPFPSDEDERTSADVSTPKGVHGILADMADLSFEEEDNPAEASTDKSTDETPLHDGQFAHEQEIKQQVDLISQSRSASSAGPAAPPPEEPDDFDKWLDEI